jgi:hypothetical protein
MGRGSKKNAPLDDGKFAATILNSRKRLFLPS